MAGRRFAVAVIADAHFHAMDGDFGGAGLDSGGRRLAIRSWQETATGTRAVNESAAALTAALDRIHAAGIRHVVLLGDYTDDGQRETTRRLAALLHDYDTRCGLRFYAIPGNHDVYGPHGKHNTTRLMSCPGQTVLVTSDPDVAAGADDATLTPAMFCDGQPAALTSMARFGLFRQPEHLHWETPFGPSDAPALRMHVAVSADGAVSHRLMDASYLVEPEDGLWLLMIDANVFEPRAGRTDPARKHAFMDPADAGWNALLRVKPFLMPWIADVCARAQALGKCLLTFSHYPVLDPFEDAAGSETALFGNSVFARRRPSVAVADALIGAGVRFHAGGHLHVNALTRHAAAGGTLVNLAVPALVTFPCGFKVLHAASGGGVTIETVSLADGPLDPMLMAHYRAAATDDPPMLRARDCGAFLLEQFRARLRSSRMPRDWPPEVLALLPGADTLTLARLMQGAPDLAARATDYGLAEADLAGYPLTEFATDWYVLREGGPMARGLLEAQRLRICRYLAAEFGNDSPVTPDATRAFFARFLATLGATLRRMDRDETRTER